MDEKQIDFIASIGNDAFLVASNDGSVAIYKTQTHKLISIL